jgi:penicillin-binding protein 2
VVAELAMDAPFKELGVERKNGAIVALDPRTGEVLAMVSRPAFDPNKFAVRIRPKDWKEMLDDPDKPLLNRALQAEQAPGSTFKPFVALAGLESGTIDNRFSVHCTGVVNLYGTPQRCHKVHGTVAMHTAIAQSCDSYFYTIGAKMGIDNISFYGDMAGFGRATGIDLPHEKSGLMPSAKWKLRAMREKWYAGETPSVAIGQGAVTVTPLQLARAVGGLSRGGEWHRPHLRKSDDAKSEPVRWTLAPENIKEVIDGMYAVVNEGGTGVRARLPNIEVCGKTGTAQLASNLILKGTALGREKHMRDNAWFEAFAPRDNPEIVVVGFFEHGEHGNFAAPMVRDVIKAYFDKKTRLTQLQQEKQALQARLAALVLPLAPR